MRLRVTRLSRASSVTHSRALLGPEPPEMVEGVLVLYRPPGADGRPRWSAASLDFEGTIRMCRRIAIVFGEGSAQTLWVSSLVIEQGPTSHGWAVMTESGSRYSVEMLSSGITPRTPRRVTGSFPIYDPTPVS